MNASTRSSRIFLLSLGTLLLIVLVGAACFGARRAGPRDALGASLDTPETPTQLPTREELLALRVPSAAEIPHELSMRLGASPLEAERLASVRADWEALAAAHAATPAPADAERAARRCLHHDARGRPELSQPACVTFLDRAPADPRAVAAAAILGRAASETSDGALLLEQRAQRWLDACAVEHGTCADLLAVLADDLIRGARRARAPEKLRQAALRSGRLLSWQATGPFRGDDLVAFADKNLPVPLVEDPPHTATFPLTSEDGLLLPALRGEDGIYTLRTAAEGGGDVVVYVTSGRAVRVSIDGVVVVERRRDREEPWISRAGLHLADGVHSIEVAVHAGGLGDGTSVAIVDDAGQPALRLTDAPPARSSVRARSLSGAVELLPLPKKTDSDDLEALDAGLWRHHLTRARLGLTVDDEAVAAGWLLGRFGFAPEAKVAAALTFGAADDIPRRQAWALVEPLWRQASAQWPGCVRARLALANAERAERPEQGLALFRALVVDEPGVAAALRVLIQDASNAGMIDEAVRAADAVLATARTPRNIDAALPAYEAAGDARKVAGLVREREGLMHSAFNEGPARRALARGDTDAALDLLQRGSRIDRDVTPQHIDLLGTTDTARALQLAEQEAARAPDDARAEHRRCALVLAVHGEEAARQAVKKALLRFPIDDTLERLAEHLGVGMRWRSRLGRGDDAIRTRRGGAEPFPGYPAVFLLDDFERWLNVDGSSRAVRHSVIELRAKESIDRFGELDVSDERVLVLRVVKPDGRVMEPDTNAGVKDVSLPGLAPGDILEMLTLEFGSGSAYPRSAYETRMLDLQSLPAVSRTYVVEAPLELMARTGFAPVRENGAPEPVREDFVDDLGVARVRFSTTLTDVPAARPEPLEPAREETARMVGFSWGADAALFARIRGRPLYLAALPSPWLVASARAIAGDGSDEEKLARVFGFVARRIEAGSANDAAEVLATGQGSRTALFLALLRAAGLRAEPLALHLPSQPPPNVIDNDAWSVLAVRVLLRDREVIGIVDHLTVLDALPRALAGARTLQIGIDAIARGEARTGVLPDSAFVDEGVHVGVQLAYVAAEGALVGDVVVTLPPALADGMRREVKKATPDQQKSYVEQALQASFPGMEVTEARFPNLEGGGTPMRFGARVRLPIAPGPDGALRFEHVFAQGAAAAFSVGPALPRALAVSERTRPLLVVADLETLELTLTVGQGGALVEAPPSLALTAGPFSLEQTAEITDGTLSWRRVIKSEHARVPAAEWPALRPALAELASRIDAHIAVVIAGPQ